MVSFGTVWYGAWCKWYHEVLYGIEMNGAFCKWYYEDCICSMELNVNGTVRQHKVMRGMELHECRSTKCRAENTLYRAAPTRKMVRKNCPPQKYRIHEYQH